MTLLRMPFAPDSLLDIYVKQATILRMALLPPFTDAGLLPPGDYPLTLEQLAASMLVVGPGDPERYPNWDSAGRGRLVQNLGVLAGQLWQAGIAEIFIDGSFVEDKERPNDIDGYFVCDMERLVTGELERTLNALDPYKVWTWDPANRRPFRGYPKLQLPMWHVYRVEFYPHYGQPSGIWNQKGDALTFPQALRTRRDDTPKGIVQLVRGES